MFTKLDNYCVYKFNILRENLHLKNIIFIYVTYILYIKYVTYILYIK